ncbi:undecaprenyl-diphosphate phosphatase [Actinoplanes sp. CA-142083]|uniref:undecaprenyl-diphosphate phosphatase n=1 Tax=Actinoplanes sp. CA-142083 TaxID=3239903 RepID=UPI003D92636C
MDHASLTYPEAIVIGLLQGVTELFPVSSLGHSILLPAVIGGRWAADLSMSADNSPYLAFVVAVHVATAVALVWFFKADWVRIVRGLLTSVRHRSITNADERLAWLLIAATIPVGLAGLALEHIVRTALGRPLPAAVFLILNGILLASVERLRSRQRVPALVGGDGTHVSTAAGNGVSAGRSSAGAGQGGAGHSGAGQGGAGRGGDGGSGDGRSDAAPDGRIASLSWGQALLIGSAQILALLPGISRSGSTIGVGLLRGLSHEDAARFAFLLATPVIAAAGVLKLPELAGPEGRGILGPVLVGSLVAGVAAYVSLRFLTRYFETRTLNPFAIYCVLAGTAGVIWSLA